MAEPATGEVHTDEVIGVALMMQGWQRADAEDWEGAEARFRKALALLPDDPQVMQALASVCYQREKYDEAIGHFRRVLSMVPDDLSCFKSLANCYSLKKDYAGAIPWLEKIVADETTTSSWLLSLAHCYLNVHDCTRAAGAIEKILISTPDDAEWIDKLAYCYLQLDKTDAALPLMEKLAAHYPSSPRLWDQLGALYIKAGRPDEAGEALVKSLELAPDNLMTALDLASLYRKSPERDMAPLGRLVTEHPSGPVYLARALSFLNRRDTAAAKEDAKVILKKYPGDSETPQYTRGLAHYIIAQDYLKQGDNQHAEKELKKALGEALPGQDRLHAINALSIAQYHLGKYRAAKTTIERALEAMPRHETYLDNHIEFCRKTGAAGELLQSALVLAQTRRSHAAQTMAIAADLPGRDAAPLLLESSIDLKLTADGKVKIIELNDLYASGFDGFKRAYGLMMREDIVFPFHDALQSRLREEAGSAVRIVRPDHSKQRLSYLCQAARDGGNVYSSTLPWWAMNEYKDFMHLTVPGEWDHMFPRTLVVPRDAGLSDADMARMAEQVLDRRQGNGSGSFVIKPCDDSIGRGVELTGEDKLVSRMREIAAWQAPKGDYWFDHPYPNFLVQECIRSRPVEAANGRLYDGTMRVAFTAVISPDRKTVQDIAFHGAYWKLPSRPYDHEDSRNAVVSFPPSELSKIANKAFAAEIPVSAQVNDDDCRTVCDQLRPFLSAALPSYAIDARGMRDQIEGLISSGSHARAALGVELATSFQAATAIDLLCGTQAAADMKELLHAALSDAKADNAAARYFDFLANSPVRNAGHAASIAKRALDILEPRAERVGAGRDKPYLKARNPVIAKIIS